MPPLVPPVRAVCLLAPERPDSEGDLRPDSEGGLDRTRRMGGSTVPEPSLPRCAPAAPPLPDMLQVSA